MRFSTLTRLFLGHPGVLAPKSDTTARVTTLSNATSVDVNDTKAAADILRSSLCHASEVYEQIMHDAEQTPPAATVTRFFARILGDNFVRRVSNFFRLFNSRELYCARREYPVLPQTAQLRKSNGSLALEDGQAVTAKAIAERYKPATYTINKERIDDPGLTPDDMRYEVLPPKDGSSFYSIIYYIKSEDENMPLPVIGKIYDWLRPILWGSKADWEALQIDIDRDSLTPVGSTFETCLYNGNPKSYYTNVANKLHVRVDVKKLSNGAWEHIVYRRNGTKTTSSINDPFQDSTHVKLAYVSWNGNFDIVESLQKRQYCLTTTVDHEQNMWITAQPGLEFLDIRTYRDQGFDLRSQWLRARKVGQCVMQLPARQGSGRTRSDNLCLVPALGQSSAVVS